MCTVSDVLVIRGAVVRPGPGEPPVQDATVVLAGGRIEAVGPGVIAPHGVPVIDARGRTLVAGFWNGHVHLTEPCWAGASRRSAAQLDALLADMFMSHGFTTVADLASDPRNTIPLKRRIESGELAGPRVYTAGMALYPAGGLPFYVRESVPWYLRWALPTPWTALGARLAVGRQLRGGAEVIKLFTGSYVTPTRIRPMAPWIARAAVGAAHSRHALVFAHTSNKDGLAVALEAGVDVIAHVPDETADVLPLLRCGAADGVVMVPTLQMFARTVNESRAYLDPLYEGLRAFRSAGGRLMFGTDVGYMRDYTIDGELQALKECGLDADAVLATLTTIPTEVFGVRDTGRVAPGCRADLVLLGSDPWTDLTGFADVWMTIRGGRILWKAPAASDDTAGASINE